MLDNVLIGIIRTIIINQEAIAGIPALPIKQAFQPTQQGVNTGPTAYFHITGWRRIGYPYRADVYDEDQQKMIHTELQQYETDFQISTLSTQDPKDTDQYTAGDILKAISYILQSQKTVEELTANQIGILRVRDIRNIPFKDDRDRWEYMPTLDFTITNKQIVTSEIPVLQSTEFNIYQI